MPKKTNMKDLVSAIKGIKSQAESQKEHTAILQRYTNIARCNKGLSPKERQQMLSETNSVSVFNYEDNINKLIESMGDDIDTIVAYWEKR